MVTSKRHLQSSDPLLAELGALYGVQLSYRDSRGQWRDSPVKAVIQVLRALGAELGDRGVGNPDDPLRGVTQAGLAAAVRERRRQFWSRMIEPVMVAWEGKLPPVMVRLPEARNGASRGGLSSGRPGRARLSLMLEEEDNSAARVVDVDMGALRIEDVSQVGRGRLEAYRLSGSCLKALAGEDARIPWGYHRLRVEFGDLAAEATLVSAPRRCWEGGPALGAGDAVVAAAARDGSGGRYVGRHDAPSTRHDALNTRHGTSNTRHEALSAEALWGLFAPLYALRSARNWGAGDLADLEDLAGIVAEAGGTVVATLPLLASYLDRPFEPAPYRPVSRLFWNEFYLAVERTPEWESCEAARGLWSAHEVQGRLEAFRAAPLVDYREVMALKRRVLEEMSSCFFREPQAERMEAFSRYLAVHPEAEQYAAFRAEVECAGGMAHGPVEEAARGAAGEGIARAAEQYHLFCQWQMDEQLGRLGQCGSGAGLLLDLPLGVHPRGFDTWRWPELFAGGMSTGAPPDAFFSLGQDWDFYPAHPDRAREQGHRYFAEALRHHMRYASHLRVDHIMSLHRLFWVPDGMSPRDGVYVTYPAEEAYAVLALESQRSRTVVVGEDLGTVPTGVRASMRRHGVLGMWVMQSSIRSRGPLVLPKAPSHTVVSLNTHDMFPFAGFLRGDDITARVKTGQLSPELAVREAEDRRRLTARLAAGLAARGAGTTGLVATGLATTGLDDRPAPGSATRPVPCSAPDLTADPTPDSAPGPLETPAVAEQPTYDKEELLLLALEFLVAQRAPLALINLEDLLLETRPQNLPGTGAEWGNWRRKVAATEGEVRQAVAELGRRLKPQEEPEGW